MSRVHLVFDNDVISPNLTLNGSVYIDYATGRVYSDATGNSLGYVTVTNANADSVSTYEVSKLASPNSGEYKLTFGSNAGSHVVVSYAGEQPSLATIKYTNEKGTTKTAHNDPVQPCFCSGTRIGTTRGEIAVEQLAIGDVVITAGGEQRPIRWIGHRRLDLARHPNPGAVRPIRVEAGAFGAGLPVHDLWLSPGHAVEADGVLIPIKYLVNGTTIAQVALAETTYWHVELESHDILLAEGLAAESYLDTGNRSAFENDGEVVALFPEFDVSDETGTCRPLHKRGATVAAVRERLLRLAEQSGYGSTDQPDLHVIVDGVRLDASGRGRVRYRFDIPEGAKDLALASRTWVPAHRVPTSNDWRRLGAGVCRLTLDGVDVGLADLGEGWERAESDGRRWMRDGLSKLPPGARVIEVELRGQPSYWLAADADVSEERMSA